MSSVKTPEPGVLPLSGERGLSSVKTPEPGVLPLSGERGSSSVKTPESRVHTCTDWIDGVITDDELAVLIICACSS